MASQRSKIHVFDGMACALPAYSDVFEGAKPTLPDLLRSANRTAWIESVSHLITATQIDYSARDRAEAQVHSYFDLREIPKILGASTRRPKLVLDPFALLVLLQVAAAHAPRIGPTPSFPAMARMAVKASFLVFECLADEVPDSADQLLGPTQTIIERSDWATPLQLVRRSYGVWIQNHSFVEDRCKLARARVENHLRARTGLALRDWVAGVSWLSWGAILSANQPNTPVLGMHILPYSTLSAYGNSTIAGVAQELAVSEETFVELARANYPTPAVDERPTILPVRRNPLIHHQTQGFYLVCSPKHLAEAGFSRPFLLAETDPTKRQETRGYLGDCVEAYMHFLLQRAFGSSYAKLDLLGEADGCALFGDLLVVFECKSALRNLLTRAYAQTTEQFLHEWRARYGKCTKQFNKTIQRILAESPRRVRRAICVVVPYESHALFPGLEDAAPTFLESDYDIAGCHVSCTQVLPLVELEWLAGVDWSPKENLLAKVRDKDTKWWTLQLYLMSRGKRSRTTLEKELNNSLLQLMAPMWADKG